MSDIFETLGFFVLDNWKKLAVVLVLLAVGVAVLYPNIGLESKKGAPTPTSPPPVTTAPPTTTPAPITAPSTTPPAPTTTAPTTTMPPPPVTTAPPTITPAPATTPAPTTTAPTTTMPPPPVITAPPASMPTSAPPTLLLEIIDQKKTYGPNGNVYLNGEVRNNWTIAAYEVRVSATFYDKDGNVLVTMTRSPMEKLKPNASQSFKIPSGYSDVTVDHYTIKATSPTITIETIQPTTIVAPKIEAEIISQSEEITNDQKLAIKGEIKNTGEEDLYGVQVSATFYDEYGKELEGANSYPIETLSPGDTRSFSIVSDHLKVNIASYTLKTLSK